MTFTSGSVPGSTPAAGSPATGSPVTVRHYSLTHLRDHVLRQELSACARQERVATADLLARIAEFDERRLYSDAACSSMLDYCVRELHMSEDSSLRRIRVGRTARAFPAIFPMLADGRLTLTAVLLLTPMLNEANATELLAAAEHRTKSEIEMLLATAYPQQPLASQAQLLTNSGNTLALEPPVPSDSHRGDDSAGPLSNSGNDQAAFERDSDASNEFAFVASERDAESLDDATGNALGASSAADDLDTAPCAPPVAPGPRVSAASPTDLVATAPAAHGLPRYLRFTPVSAECAALKGMLSLEAMREFKRLQELVGKLGASADAAELLEKAIKAYADAIAKKKFGTGVRSRTSKSDSNGRPMKGSHTADPNRRHGTRPGRAAPNRSDTSGASDADQVRRHVTRSSRTTSNRRYIPAAIRKAVHDRDGGQCTFVSPDGKRCQCRAGLQFDHVKPLARGGETTVTNLRLLCHAHNQLEARRSYGAPFVRGKQERARQHARAKSGTARDRARRSDTA